MSIRTLTAAVFCLGFLVIQGSSTPLHSLSCDSHEHDDVALPQLTFHQVGNVNKVQRMLLEGGETFLEHILGSVMTETAPSFHKRRPSPQKNENLEEEQLMKLLFANNELTALFAELLQQKNASNRQVDSHRSEDPSDENLTIKKFTEENLPAENLTKEKPSEIKSTEENLKAEIPSDESSTAKQSLPEENPSKENSPAENPSQDNTNTKNPTEKESEAVEASTSEENSPEENSTPSPQRSRGRDLIGALLAFFYDIFSNLMIKYFT